MEIRLRRSGGAALPAAAAVVVLPLVMVCRPCSTSARTTIYHKISVKTGTLSKEPLPLPCCRSSVRPATGAAHREQKTYGRAARQESGAALEASAETLAARRHHPCDCHGLRVVTQCNDHGCVQEQQTQREFNPAGERRVSANDRSHRAIRATAPSPDDPSQDPGAGAVPFSHDGRRIR